MSDTDTQTPAPRRSPALAVAGLAALAVSLWALIGPGTLSFVGDVDVRWVFVGAAAVVGLVLVAIPARRRGRRRDG